MTTGKDDLTKHSQLGSNTALNDGSCPECQPGDGQYHLKQLGFSDALRYSGKMDVVDKPMPHEMYGFYLQVSRPTQPNPTHSPTPCRSLPPARRPPPLCWQP